MKQRTSWKTADTRKAISNATACAKRLWILNLAKEKVQDHFKQQVGVLSIYIPIKWDLTEKYIYVKYQGQLFRFQHKDVILRF